MVRNTSQHILNTSANLLGFCLFVITSLHISNRAQASIMDECTSVIAILLIFSCLFSFISLRTKSDDKEKNFETIAEYFFLVSLIGILVIISLIALHFLK